MSDVCLILEGTYPYVTGGVSSCVYQMIKASPHLSYSIFYIGATQDGLGEYKYPIPSNVRMIKKIFLFDYFIEGKLKKMGKKFDPILIMKFHQEMKSGNTKRFKEIYTKYFDVDTSDVNPFDFLQSEEAWVLLEKMYSARFSPVDAPSFIDYFYTWRFTHYPIFKVLTSELPKADIYHALCTGYAGLAGVMARFKFERPFILTEHGIYSHERRIEILQSQWLLNTDTDVIARRQLPIFKDWWIKVFEFLSLLAYEEADVITTLYDGNREKQIAYGARPEKIRIIPNGVDYPHFSKPIAKVKDDVFTIGFVGRVVPIKDVKTFIKSIAFVKGHSKKIRVLIVGPTEEDEAYFHDCEQLVELLGLNEIIEFTGKLNTQEIYPILDVLVLSSISEGQPLVILEAYCQGVPVIATDVGSCRELIFGMTRDDKALGPSGDVIPFGRADYLGQSILKIMENDELRKQMGATAKRRVETYYQEKTSVGNYLSLYNEFFADRFWYGRNRV
jgi:glycosyltransferase involved in cell wall biosynthesis